MADVHDICEGVGDHLPEILDDWRELVVEQPWLDLPPDVDMDHLPELLEAIVRATIADEDDSEARRALTRFSLKHGQHRRKDGFDDHVLFQEYHALREAIWRGILRRYRYDPNRFPAIARMDTVITAATVGSLHGYHGYQGDEDEARREALAEELAAKVYWPSGPSERSAPPERPERPERPEDDRG